MADLRFLEERDEPGVDAIGWALRIGLAIAFVAFGVEKFDDSNTGWVNLFARLGGQWFRYATGAIEVGGALLLLIPRTVLVGALVLGATMLGAIAVHVAVLGQPGNVVIPGLFLAGFVFVARRHSALH